MLEMGASLRENQRPFEGIRGRAGRCPTHARKIPARKGRQVAKNPSASHLIFFAFPVAQGRHSHALFEHPGKVALILEAHQLGNVRQA